MGIRIGQGFQRTGAFPVDETIVLTKAQMIGIDDSLMPDKYFTICQDDGKLYLYDKSATPTAETGKFSVLSGGSISRGWGIAKSGVLQAPITNQRGDIVIPVNDLGLASGNDYNVALTIVGGGTGSWGDALTYLYGKSATQANGAVVTTGTDVDRVDVSYIVVAKGYGSNVSGWGIAKVGYVGVEFGNSTWSEVSTVNISDLGLNANTDYEVFVEQVGGGTLAAWGDSTTYVGSKSKDNFTVGAVKPEAVSGTLNVKYIVFAKGYGGGAGGDNSIFEVKFSGSTSSVTCDKTFAEISDAITANKIIVAKRDFYGGFYVVQADGNSIEFQSIRAIDVGKYRCETITITDTNTITATSMDYDDIVPTATMPMSTAAVPEGLILLYTGETTSEYTHGSFYRRNASGGYDLLNNSQGGSYDDTELRTMIGNVADLQTASHEVVGAINELQTGNVFPVVNPSKITSNPLVFLRENSNSDTFWLYNINGYPGNPVDMSAYVPAGSNSFYLRTDLIYSKKGEPVNTRGYTSTVECFMTDDGFTSNPGQRSGVAYIQLHGGGTMTARIQYVPATGRLYMDSNVQLAKEEELARRPVAYSLNVDEHFIAPNISYGYSKTKEFLPGAQVDLEFWNPADFGPDFDVDDPTTWPTPMATYTGSVIDNDLKFTINGVVGQYNATRNVVEIDLTSFPEYDSAEENGSLYIHGTMVKKIDSILLPNDGSGGSITVDDDLDATSSNPVKNRTIAGVFESFRQLFTPSTYIPNGQIVFANDFTAAYQFPTGVFPADCFIIFYYDGAKKEALTVVDRGAQYEGQGQWALVGEGGTEITYMDIIPTANPQEFMFAPVDALTTSLDFYYKKQASPVTKLVMDELELELGNNSGF